MRTYVSPIGYNSTSVVRPVLSCGLDSGDEIVLLRPDDDADEPRSREAIDDVNRLIAEIEPEVTLSVERLTHEEYPTAVLECCDVLEGAQGDVVVNLGGGARDLLVPLTTAALIHAETVTRTLSFSDVDGSVRDLELPAVTASVRETVVPTLREIATHDGHVLMPTLTERLDRSKSSITRHVTELEATGLVRSEKHGRTKVLELTFAGELYLRARNEQ